MQNIFSNPKKYRKSIVEDLIFQKLNLDNYAGKGIACVFLTRFCPVGCKFCFFKSAPKTKEITTEDAFTEYNFPELLKFINDANLAYLLVSGGGDPFINFEQIISLIKNTTAKKIVIVTSGYWAKNIDKASEYILKLNEAVNNTKFRKKITLRISLDSDHAKQLTDLPAKNIYKLFHILPINHKKFYLKYHTMIDDPIIQKFITDIKSDIKSKTDIKMSSDSKHVKKACPYDSIIKTKDGLTFEIGFANRFYPDDFVDLHTENIITRNLEVFNENIQQSEDFNSSVAFNNNGKKGLDFWINYNGNICTWGNQIKGNIFNIKANTYKEITYKTMNDPISRSYIEKGHIYRTSLINEISPKTVIKSQAVNIRDYVGALLFEEYKIQLYYSIRAIQDYLKEGIKIDLSKVLPEIQKAILLSKEELITLYNEANYDIIDQLQDEFKIIPTAILAKYIKYIKLGQYDITNKNLKILKNEYKTIDLKYDRLIPKYGETYE